jgi:hypothetical protein
MAEDRTIPNVSYNFLFNCNNIFSAFSANSAVNYYALSYIVMGNDRQVFYEIIKFSECFLVILRLIFDNCT